MQKNKIEVNDNELLYLIQEGNEEALELMFLKYEPLIIKKIKSFKLNNLYFEDYLQEGRLMLHKAIRCYNINSAKTFNRYFDLLLTNRFISILRKTKKEIDESYKISEALSVDNTKYDEKLEDVDFSQLHLSNMEKEVYKYRFLRNMKITDICQILNVSEKTVYNSIQRIKRKLDKIKI